MEQATNLFTKGLLSDTHPMVQGNDTLTDCLNGTLVTMNGNEVILLNDMGNRRVDNAFLPAGYEPVGMKEYGGIIYVAAYNPITNKSLIGSFPSPEKKLSSKDDPLLQGTFDFASFWDSKNVVNDSELNLNVLKTDSFMIPLTGETSLRAGDKFVVYATGLSSLANYITNYNNTSNNKANSPKNKEYTLQLGVLNSLNEFVDITKTLCRWKNNGIVNYTDEVSEVFKFNDGYFIPDSFNNSDFWESINDNELIKHRQVMEANTYAYKLIGPLYLKVTFNHILNFNYNIYGINNGNSTINLWIEGFLTYNCPDGVNTQSSSSDENYNSFYEGEPTFEGFTLIGENPTSTTKTTSIYSPKNNTYTTKIVKEYKNIGVIDNKYDYTIGVLANNSNVYLKGLSVKGSIDVSLLGTGTVALTGWKFYNNLNQKSSTLTFSFNAYPEYGKSFDDLRFTFTNIKDSNDTHVFPSSGELPLYNGRQTYLLDWEEIGLKPRKVYSVSISYLESDKPNRTTLTESTYRWFLTTELFNEFYLSIPDFCTTNNLEFQAKMGVKTSASGELIDNTKETQEFIGGLTSSTSNISYKCKHTLAVNFTSTYRLYIENENLYPDFITMSHPELCNLKDDLNPLNSNLDLLFTLSNGELNNGNFKLLLFPTRGNIAPEQAHADVESLTSLTNDLPTVNSNKKLIQGNLIYYDLYSGYNSNKLSNINNCFCNLEDILGDGLPNLNGKHAGISINYAYDSPWKHYLEVVERNSNIVPELPDGSSMELGTIRIAEKGKSNPVVFYFDDYEDDIYEAFNNRAEKPGLMFTFVFLKASLNGNSDKKYLYFSNTESIDPSSASALEGTYNTRMWWRTSNGEWATFPDLLNYSPSNPGGPDNLRLEQFITNHFPHGKKYVYCMYDTYSENIDLYAADLDYLYYQSFSIPVNMTIGFTKGNNTISGLGNLSSSPSLTSNLTFTEGDFNSPIGRAVIYLNSSSTFLELARSFRIDLISNIYIGSEAFGKLMDIENKKLNANSIYYLDSNNNLHRDTTNQFKVDRDNTINGKNTLTYNKYNVSGLSLGRFLISRSESIESRTALSYRGVNVISLT